MKAIFNKTVVAQSDKTVVIEGNHYFPLESIHSDYFTETNHHSTCPWKGEASYYTLEVNDEISENAAWFYNNPKDAAKEIKNYVAFWKNVAVEEQNLTLKYYYEKVRFYNYRKWTSRNTFGI